MRAMMLAAGLCGLLAGAGQALAQGAGDASVGKAAGTVMLRVRAIGVLPQVSSSSVSTIGGKVDASNSAAPEVDVSYFFTDNIAAELIAASTQHTMTATGTSLGRVKVGDIWVLPPTLTVQYHFQPHERFSPYVGAGVNATFFYASSPNKPAITKVDYDNNIGAAIQAGFDYNISGRWFINADIKQIFVNTAARINGGAIVAKTALDPTVVGVGVGYRF